MEVYVAQSAPEIRNLIESWVHSSLQPYPCVSCEDANVVGKNLPPQWPNSLMLREELNQDCRANTTGKTITESSVPTQVKLRQQNHENRAAL
eukprot:1650859-Amphidinium_carterae.1